MEKSYLKQALPLVIEAGKRILEVYNRDFSVEYKDDASPLTEADRVAHRLIEQGLSDFSNLPLLSEEGKMIPFAERKSWSRFWMLDPIDGTKEFIKKNGEFTVNLALVENGFPVMGIVYAPAIFEIFWGISGEGAFKGDVLPETGELSNARSLPLALFAGSDIRVVASRSHMDESTQAFIDELAGRFSSVETCSFGSSLKLCRVAEGFAQVYPRLGPTMEWDTAAADAVVRASGGAVLDFETRMPLTYNKENLLNPHFIVQQAGFELEKVEQE